MSRIRFIPKPDASKAGEAPRREKKAEAEPTEAAPAVHGEAGTDGFALTPAEEAPAKPAKKGRGKKAG